MKLDPFSVDIIGGQSANDGYVVMKHNTQYQLLLINYSGQKCDVKIEIDGKQIGTWRIHSQSHLILDRPANDNGKLTFYQHGSVEGVMAGLEESEELGLITVTFKPEKVRNFPKSSRVPPLLNRRLNHTDHYKPQSYVAPQPQAAYSHSHNGGTGLSGASSQHFVRAERIEYDPHTYRTIHLRLCTGTTSPRPLRNLNQSTKKSPVTTGFDDFDDDIPF